MVAMQDSKLRVIAEVLGEEEMSVILPCGLMKDQICLFSHMEVSMSVEVQSEFEKKLAVCFH
jgi:hypothetical protein